MTAPKRIGIAIVEHERRYLVGIRGPDVALSGFAEFPGGKCLENESADNCAIRECLEETGLRITVEQRLERLEFEYPHGRVDLNFVLCHPADANDVRHQHGEFHWVTVSELTSMKFPEANHNVIDLIIRMADEDRRRSNEA